MGTKRHHALAGDGADESSSTKRRREQHSSKPKQTEGKPDPTYGQRVAFPGLDDDGAKVIDDDLEFEEDADALAYLRAVRQEASSVPHVLVAPKAGPQLPSHLQHTDDIDRSIYDDGVGDSRGYYHDGAYTAAPSPPPSTPPSALADDDDDYPHSSSPGPDRIAAQNAALRAAYFASLTAHFLSLRALLHRTPPAHLVAALPRDHGTEVGAFGAKSWTFRVWTRRLRQTDPLPVQVAALDRTAALRLLRVLLGGKFVRRGCELRERTSRWIWALLARLPDRGEMDYADVGWVRELGKRAVLMMVSMAQMEALREEVEGDLEGGVEGEEEEDEEFVGEMVVDEGEEGGGAVVSQGSGDTESKPAAHPAANAATAADESQEEGEIDMDIDDGEVSDDEAHPTATANTSGNEDIAADIAAAKARLLARLENPDEEPSQGEEEEKRSSTERAPATAGAFDEAQAQVNMRTTLNMILTVAGEFYGQRDLLEFRDPFPAV